MNPAGGASEVPAVGLLGGFSLAVRGTSVCLGAGSQRLIALLALSGRTVSRASVASKLWADTPSAKARCSLRTAIWRANTDAELIEASGDLICINESVVVDVHALEVITLGFLDEGTRCSVTPELLAQLSRWSHELLPESDCEWLLLERERYRQRGLHSLEAVSIRLRQLGRHGDAIDIGLVAVGVDPLRESAHRVVIEAHLANGNRTAAVRQFRDYERLIRTELALDPTSDMVTLISGSAA